MWNYLFDFQAFTIFFCIFLEIERKYIILPSRTGKYSPVLLPDSITVVQATLTRFVLVRIQVRQQENAIVSGYSVFVFLPSGLSLSK